jgi:hypothetical protein
MLEINETERIVPFFQSIRAAEEKDRKRETHAKKNSEL